MAGAKGRSGRRPLPTSVKSLRGNPGKRKPTEGEPKPAAGRPDMPAGLSKAAAIEWNDIVPQLELLGVLSRIDGKALAAYCHAYSRWWEAEQHVTEHGLVLEEPILNKDGDEVGTRWKKNPAVSISRDAMRDMKAFLIEFGMTPASRTRLRIEPKPNEDPEEAYIRRKMLQQPVSTLAN